MDTKDIVLGYFLTVFVAFAAIMIGWLCQKIFKLKIIYSRKISHILLFFILPLAHHFLGTSWHIAVLTFFSLIVNIISWKFRIFKSVEDGDKNNLGTIFYSLSVFLCAILIWLYPSFYYETLCCYAILSFGDGFAAIVGSILPLKIPIVKNKTLFGSLAMFLFSSLSIVVCNELFSFGFNALEIIALASAVTIAELLPYFGLDNLSIMAVGTAFFISLQYGFISTPLLIAIVGSLVFIYLVVPFGILTSPAAFTAVVFMLVISYSTSYRGMLIVIIPFILSSFVYVYVKKRNKKEKTGNPGERKGRKTIQIVCNALPMTLCCFAYIFIKENFLIVGMTLCCAVAVADSASSDIGQLSNKTPFDIITRKPVQKGISGGITLFGSICGCVTLLFMCALYLVVVDVNWLSCVYIFSFGVLGLFLDSLIGSRLQALYFDEETNTYLETPPAHDSIPIKGIKWINNHATNIISQSLAAISFVILQIILLSV